MPQLRTFPWWPKEWTTAGGDVHTPQEIRKAGVLKNARRSLDGLILMVDLNGITCTAAVIPPLSDDMLTLLRHLLLQRFGESMEAVEDLDVEVDGVFPVVK